MLKLLIPLIALVASTVTSCKQEKEIVYVDVEVIKEIEVIKEVQVDGGTTTVTEEKAVVPTLETTTDPESTDLMLTGSLAVDSGAAAIGLTSFGLAADESVHSIYCTTFEDDPIACAAEVVGGEFSKSCLDYAGKTFGCFL